MTSQAKRCDSNPRRQKKGRQKGASAGLMIADSSAAVLLAPLI
jgi:hypothetical protein